MNFIKPFILILLLATLGLTQEVHAKANLYETHILDLHPTQIPIGLRAAKRKAEKLMDMSKSELIEYLYSNPVPVVMGPNNKLYIVDHHHLCLALDMIGKKEVTYKIIGDLSGSKNMTEFWTKMINENGKYGDYKWAYDHDENGKKLSVKDFMQKIGSNIRKMKDDPFRSIAARLRDRGDFIKKENDYFMEFVIGNYLRQFFYYEKSKDWYENTLRKSEKILTRTLQGTRKCSKIMEELATN